MNNKELSRINSFDKIDLEKSKLRNGMNYQKELMTLGYERLANNFKASVVESVKDIAQSALTDVLIRLIRGK